MNTIILTLSFVLVVTVYLTSASPIPKEQSPVFYNPYRFKRFGQDKNLKANNEADSQSIVYVPNGAVNNVNSNSLQPDDSNQKDRQLRQIPAEVPERVARQIYPAEEDGTDLVSNGTNPPQLQNRYKPQHHKPAPKYYYDPETKEMRLINQTYSSAQIYNQSDAPLQKYNQSHQPLQTSTQSYSPLQINNETYPPLQIHNQSYSSLQPYNQSYPPVKIDNQSYLPSALDNRMRIPLDPLGLMDIADEIVGLHNNKASDPLIIKKGLYVAAGAPADAYANAQLNKYDSDEEEEEEDEKEKHQEGQRTPSFTSKIISFFWRIVTSIFKFIWKLVVQR